METIVIYYYCDTITAEYYCDITMEMVFPFEITHVGDEKFLTL